MVTHVTDFACDHNIYFRHASMQCIQNICGSMKNGIHKCQIWERGREIFATLSAKIDHLGVNNEFMLRELKVQCIMHISDHARHITCDCSMVKCHV